MAWLVAGSDQHFVEKQVELIKTTFDLSMNVLTTAVGSVRTGNQARHEHFGTVLPIRYAVSQYVLHSDVQTTSSIRVSRRRL